MCRAVDLIRGGRIPLAARQLKGRAKLTPQDLGQEPLVSFWYETDAAGAV